MTLYKWTDAEGKTWGGFQWPLPQGDKPGAWVPALEGEIIPCEHGYHACKTQDLTRWISTRLFVIECQGDVVRQEDNDNKSVYRGPCRLIREVAAWNERTARLFACDCADHVLPIYEKAYPNDTRVRDCIAVVRRYADGAATESELATAAAHAYAAAYAAAHATDAAAYATDAAAYAAATNAYAATNAAAYATERQWQTKHFIEMLGLEAT